MPINSVASQIRLTSHKPQQKFIHCNSVPTDKFLAFDKTKYGENTFVNQMTENVDQNIICNKCHNAILRESLVTCLTYDKTMKKMFTLKFDMDKYSTLENPIWEMLKSNRANCYICKSCHLRLQPKCTCVCCNTDVQKIHVKCTKSRLWLHKFCCITMLRTRIKSCKQWRPIYMCIMW